LKLIFLFLLILKMEAIQVMVERMLALDYRVILNLLT